MKKKGKNRKVAQQLKAKFREPRRHSEISRQVPQPNTTFPLNQGGFFIMNIYLGTVLLTGGNRGNSGMSPLICWTKGLSREAKVVQFNIMGNHATI